MKEYQIVWKADREQLGEQEAQEYLETVESRVQKQTDEQIEIGEVHHLEPASIAISYLIGVASGLTAYAIINFLEEQDETEEVYFHTEAEIEDITDDEDQEVELSITLDSE